MLLLYPRKLRYWLSSMFKAAGFKPGLCEFQVLFSPPCHQPPSMGEELGEGEEMRRQKIGLRCCYLL